ncbi:MULTISPECIES: type VII secretion target [Kitasatospora]|uniref:Uncharacterized protein n=1 Tax=Kitasatospora cystarginea TaxID=58350 RepID=A0ABN3EBB4_9ACTN
MSDGYHVHPDALDVYAGQVEDAAERVSQIMSAIGSISVPSDAFGLLPDAQNLHSAYQEHSDADVQDCLDLDGLLRETVEGLTGASGNYRDAESATSGAMGGGA